jgi:hypothetical protein
VTAGDHRKLLKGNRLTGLHILAWGAIGGYMKAFARRASTLPLAKIYSAWIVAVLLEYGDR